MATNPVVHNDGGINRFIDYLSTVPEFLQVEDDVVSMLQLFSDYINNAYRNTAIVDKFRIKLIATDNNVVAVQNDLKRLATLFSLTEARSLKMLYISKPQGNPRAGSGQANELSEYWPIFREIIEYDGTIDTLGTSIITIPNAEDGDKFYIEFTKDGQESNTGVYVLNKSRNLLQLDPNGTSQDPFNNTPNKPFITDVGIAPRILEFNVSDVSEVGARRASRDGNITYYEVFFDATIFNISDVSGTVVKNINNNGTAGQDFKYVIDYYDTIETIPSVYEFKYEIEFADGCKNIDWKYNENTMQMSDKGYSMFYARDLTDIDQVNTLVNREGRNIYNDPIFNLNTSGNDIVEINGNGIDITVTTKYRHSLSENDKVSIFDTQNFNGNYIVSKVIDYNIFRISSTITGNEISGRVVNRNLFYSKLVDDPSTFNLVVPYVGLDADREYEENDFLYRASNDIEPLIAVFDATNVDTNENLVSVNSLYGFPNVASNVPLKVTIRGNGGTLPTGLTEAVIYDMYIKDISLRQVSFSGVDITAAGSGEFEIYYEGEGRKYFDSASDVNLSNNSIKLNVLDNLYVGANIYIRANSSAITLPTPLESNKPYQIKSIDDTTNEITFTDIELTATGSGIADISVVIQSTDSNGRVDYIQIEEPITDFQDGKGKVTLKSYVGDMISSGLIARYDKTNRLVSLGSIDSSASVWTTNQLYDSSTIGGVPAVYPLYHKGQLVVYNNIRYRLINAVQIDENSGTPISDPENYERYMDDIITRPTIVTYNPYMYGLQDVNSLGFDEEVDFTKGYSTLGNQMYIQQIEDLALRYGFDQREWLFNPRFAPQESVVRNGSLDFIKNSEEFYNPVNNKDVALSISKANTVSNMTLFGINEPVVRRINSLETLGGIATVETVGEHGYKTGTAITIKGSDVADTNGTFTITVVDSQTFTYITANASANTASGVIESIYQPNVGDFVNVISQTDSDDNGIYIVKINDWVKYDSDKLQSPSIVFCKQNLFDVGELNPSVAKGELVSPSIVKYVGSGLVQVTTTAPHGYTVGTTIEIRNAFEYEFNGRYEVESIINEFTFNYQIGFDLVPNTFATGNITCQNDAWYQYRLDEIQWQKISKLTENDFLNKDGSEPLLIEFNDGKDNVDLLSGIYSFTKSDGSVVRFTDGLIVKLEDQLISVEDGVYRVGAGLWERLDTKLSIKVRDMRINAYDNPNFVGLDLDEEEVIYRTFSDAEVAEYISSNSSTTQLIYKASYPFVQNFEFIFEKVENIDTTASIDREYDARQDYNSVVNTSDMDSSFDGIPDMRYPIVEKIERIAYNKDPRAIDLELIQYLARYMGYDMTDWANDIVQSPYYSTPEEVESAIRRAVEQLPQYYSLKSTNSGLELLLLTFGIVGELVTMWTPQNDPYSEFIPDYQVRGRQYADMTNGVRSNYVPTPHFAVNVNIAGNFENQILQGDQQRVVSAINRFKPINTVFNGIKQYIEATLKARITISKMNAKGKQSTSIGFENLDWVDDLIDNNCL